MTSGESSPVTAALWETVEQRWDDAAVHASFLQACSEEGTLAFAARKYREQKDGQDETRHALAQQQLEKITGLAFAQMESFKTPPTEHKRLFTAVAALVSGGLILACIYLLTL